VIGRKAASLAELLREKRIGYSEDDLRAVVAYVRGTQTCAQFDRLDAWCMAIVNVLPMSCEGRRIIP
jgi:hypothetical protein